MQSVFEPVCYEVLFLVRNQMIAMQRQHEGQIQVFHMFGKLTIDVIPDRRTWIILLPLSLPRIESRVHESIAALRMAWPAAQIC
jgi:hypothetical protein